MPGSPFGCVDDDRRAQQWRSERLDRPPLLARREPGPTPPSQARGSELFDDRLRVDGTGGGQTLATPRLDVVGQRSIGLGWKHPVRIFAIEIGHQNLLTNKRHSATVTRLAPLIRVPVGHFEPNYAARCGEDTELRG